MTYKNISHEVYTYGFGTLHYDFFDSIARNCNVEVAFKCVFSGSLRKVFDSVTVDSVQIDGVCKFVIINRKTVSCNGADKIDVEEIQSIVVNVIFLVQVFERLNHDF